MKRSEVIEELNLIFRDVMDDDSIQLSESTTANDIGEWDSINHIYMIVKVEKKFKLKFTAHEIQTWKNVGEIINSIEKGLAK